MFIRRTRTRSIGDRYFTFRLVRSERTGSKVRQRTLLNLGRHFEVAQNDWPALCRRIDELLAGQMPLPGDTPPALESGLVILLYKLPSWRGVGEGEVGSRRLGPVR